MFAASAGTSALAQGANAIDHADDIYSGVQLAGDIAANGITEENVLDLALQAATGRSRLNSRGAREAAEASEKARRSGRRAQSEG